MAARQDNIRALLAKVDAQTRKIEVAYASSLHAQTIDPELRIDIKNALENLRSALDYLATDIRERYCPTAKASAHFYFPVLPDKGIFDKKVDEWFPGLRQVCPAVVRALEAAQPYQRGQEWLGQLSRVNSDNKHSDLVEQRRVESPQTTVTGPTGSQVSWGKGVTFGHGVSVLGVPIDPRTQLPVPHPSIKVERVIWVDFQFSGIGVSALGLLKKARSGIADIEAAIRPLL